MDRMINVVKPGPLIVLCVLLLAMISALLFVFGGSLERKTTLSTNCDGVISQERIQAYFSEKLRIGDKDAYNVVLSYLDQLDDSGHYTLFDSVMSEENYIKWGIKTGSAARFENGLKGIVIGGTTAERYEDLFGEFFSYTDEDLSLMNVYPGQEPYYMIYIFTEETDKDLTDTHLSCEVITESIKLSNVLFEDRDA